MTGMHSILIAVFGAAAIVASAARAQTGPSPIGYAFVAPTTVIYPRQTIHAGMVEQRESTIQPAGGVALSFDEVLGKAARATLTPGRPIPLGALGAPELARVGAPLTLVFAQDGLDVRAAGVALQAGAAGDRIRARNASTGVTVAGTLRPDGALAVEGGP